MSENKILKEIEFGSLLSYCPRSSSTEGQRSKTVMSSIKNNKYVYDPPIQMTEYISNLIERHFAKLPFSKFFQCNPILIPVPKSSLMRSDTLWVPKKLADAMYQKGYGKSVVECVKRIIPLPRSSVSDKDDRPKAAQHYHSIEIKRNLLPDPDEILLIDDVITRGATLLGVASRISNVFPYSNIRSFVALRTISNPNEFNKIYDPCIGNIKLVGENTLRRP